MNKNSIILKSVVLLLFFGAITAYVLYRAGFFASEPIEKEVIVNTKSDTQKDNSLMGGPKYAVTFEENDIQKKPDLPPLDLNSHKKTNQRSKGKNSTPNEADDILLPGSKIAPVFEK